MLPVVTVAEMGAADAAALGRTTEGDLIRRAGTAAGLVALDMLGGAYGRRVVVVVGKGNNGADGRVVARLLAARGARVQVVDAATAPATLPPCDLFVDAAYGTGFRGHYEAPQVDPATPVLAIDIPSGVDGDTGAMSGRPARATRTATFAALKLGLVQGDGPEVAGRVTVLDIGVAPGAPAVGLVEDADLVADLPARPRQAHKWNAAVGIVAGSPGMEGAAGLSARGASHAGAGMVRLAVPGTEGDEHPGAWPIEAVRRALPAEGWAASALDAVAKCGAAVIGPGLGRSEGTQDQIRRFLRGARLPLVIDADALFALGDAGSARALLAQVVPPVVLTPHDGEYRGILGHAPGPDRVAAARALAEATGAVVLLKGSLTAVAVPPDQDPDDGEALRLPGHPRVMLTATGSPRLATAGTGDVLSGVIGAFIARGLPVASAAAFGAHAHGRAASLGLAEGLVAGDLPGLVAKWLSEQREPVSVEAAR